MKKIVATLLAFSALFVVAAVAEDMAGTKDEPKTMAKTTSMYVCDKCHTAEMQAGKCPTCGAEMKQMHVLAIKDGMAYMCPCPAGCTCELKGTDMTQCGCGKPVEKVSLKGKYVCNCGADCKCNTVSDKPGKCGCGMDLKKVE